LTATGGTPPYTFAIVSGAPTGCGSSVSSAGAYNCTPTAGGNFNAFVIRVTDSLSATSTKTFTQLVGTPQNPGVASCAQTTITFGSSVQCKALVNFSDGSQRDVTSGNSLVVGAPQTLANSPVSSVTVSITIPAGTNNGYIACGRQGADTTSAITYTDSASQTPTVIKTVVTTHFASCALQLNTAAVTTVTANTTAAASTMALTVFPVVGIPTSAALDGTPVSNMVTGSSGLSSQACGPLTTTNAVDAIFCFQDQQSAQNSFAATNAFNIPAAGANSRTAIAYEIYSTIQTALSPTISWTPALPSSAGNIMFALKAVSGATNGANWTATNGAINSTGLFTANVASGAASVSFTYGAVTSNTVSLTINGAQMDTAICLNHTGPVNPCPTVNVSGASGATVGFTATGNVTGSSYTTQATWSSSNTAVATIVAAGQAKCATGLGSPSQTTITAAFAPFTSGVGTLTCNPPISAQSLLSGCVVNAGNTSSCPAPAGWSIAFAQGFEGGISANENIGGDSINCTIGHSGNCSLDTNIPALGGGFNAAGSGDTINVANLGCCTNGDFYLSYWRQLTPGATNGGGNLDLSYVAFTGGTGNLVQQELLDCQYFSTTPTASCNFSVFPTPLFSGIDCNITPNDNGQPQNCAYVGGLFSWPIGTWEQEEFWFHAGTCSGGTPNNDAFFNQYVNGKLVFVVNHANYPLSSTGNGDGGNLNGCVDMSVASVARAAGFADFNNQNPPFHIYTDDIIILKR